MNFQTISAAVATVFGTVTATNAGVTESVTFTADLPNSVAKVAGLVYPPTGALEIIMGPRNHDVYDFPVRLLRDPLSVPQRTQWLYAWATALRPLVQRNVDLGVSGVSSAEAVGLRVELDGEKYSSVDGTYADFDVVELIVRVQMDEYVTDLAI